MDKIKLRNPNDVYTGDIAKELEVLKDKMDAKEASIDDLLNVRDIIFEDCCRQIYSEDFLSYVNTYFYE